MILSNFPTKPITPESIGAIPNPTGGTTGQVLTKTSTGEEWSDAPSGLPEGGTEGQVIKKTADGAEWDNADWLPLSGGTMTGDLTLSANGGTTTISPQDKKDVLITGRYLFFGEDTSAVGRYDYKVLTEGDYKEQFAPTSVRVLLRSFSWSDNTQTVTVSGVVASNTAQLITPIPSDSSRSAYYAAGIMCTEQAANSLTFTCQTVPTIDLIVYVVIQPLS